MKKLIIEFENYLGEQDLSANTMFSYLRDVSAFFDYMDENGIKNALAIKQEEIEDYVDYMREVSKANSTISRSIASLRKFYQCMLFKGKVEHNPVYGVETPKVKKKLPETLTTREIVKLLKQPKTTELKGIRDRAMLELLYATGIKVSELINLTTRDIDIHGGMLNCNSSKNQRYIPIGKEAASAMEEYLKKARLYMVGDSKIKTLFVNCSGTPLTRQGFWKILKGYADSAGIKTEINAQTLRNSFALHLLQNGADINAVSEMLGHTDVVTTRVYNQVLKNNIKKIYKKAHPRA